MNVLQSGKVRVRAGRHGTQRQGFTLVEILLAAGLIAILVVLLSGTFSKAFEKSQAARCMSHLRTLYVATINYASDNNNELPIDRENQATGMSWYRGLERGGYLQSDNLGENKVLFCPARADKNIYQGWTHYGVNGCLYDTGVNLSDGDAEYLSGRAGPRMNRFAKPSGKLLYMDTMNEEKTGGYSIYSANSNYTQPVHGERVNVVFLDGHVESPRVVPRELSPNGDLEELKEEWFSGQ